MSKLVIFTCSLCQSVFQAKPHAKRKYCEPCRPKAQKLSHKKYRDKNKDKLRARNKKYRAKYPEKLKKACQDWKAAHPERLREYELRRQEKRKKQKEA